MIHLGQSLKIIGRVEGKLTAITECALARAGAAEDQLPERHRQSLILLTYYRYYRAVQMARGGKERIAKNGTTRWSSIKATYVGVVRWFAKDCPAIALPRGFDGELCGRGGQNLAVGNGSTSTVYLELQHGSQPSV